MKRSIILFLGSLASVSFLIVQLLFLKGINIQKSKEPEKPQSCLEIFHATLKKHNVQIFLFDENVLECLVVNHHGTVVKALSVVGFSVRDFTLIDPRLNTIDQIVYSKIPVGYEITHKNIILNVAIVYRRNGYFWWKHKDRSGILQSIPTFHSSSIDGVAVSIPLDIKTFITDLSQSEYIDCDVKRARAFYSNYGSDDSSEANHFKTRAKEILTLAVSVLKQLKIPFWLSSGTCLGWFRQCGIIPHSKDVDLGIFIKDYKPALIEAFKEQGLFIKHIFGKVEDSYELSFRTIENDVKLDIFFFYEDEDYMWNGGTRARTGMKYKYIFPKFTLCWSELLGLLVRVPCQTRAYIEANYGKDWYKPIKEWKWNKSPPNVQENGQWEEREWPEVIQMYEIY